ncbi:MAG: TIGR02996 domain-containing protein, partial [Caldilineaceae bacterium]|nr:TIGR02996 domain-containing protein [Caldilineaceae bacterium]
MTSEADFLAAIAGRPDDELLLQVFADWLEENGEDQRASWVRSPVIRRWMGEQFESPIPAIIRVLKSRKGAVGVRRAVSLIGVAIVPELLPLLKDEDAYVRLQAVWCVRKVGKAAAGTSAVAVLLE